MTLKRFLSVFLILLACPLIAAAEIPCVWKGVEKIIAIADIHGDYENFVSLLKGTNLVNDDLHWTGGKTHLVQIGDIMDRGTGAKDALDLLMRLEKEAVAAGGVVHVLLGNHEELNITGRALDYPAYVTVEQFVAFLPEEFRKLKEKGYLTSLDDKGKALPEVRRLDLASDASLQRFWQNLIRQDANARRAYVSNFNRTYGKWLLQKNAVIKINDIILSHAGISEKYSTWKLQEINDALRSELRLFAQYIEDPSQLTQPLQPKIIYDTSSPLWYRGLATRDETVTEKEVIRTLGRLNARAMVTGHNFFQNSGQMSGLGLETVRHYGGRVYNIDTGISRLYKGLIAALVIEGNHFALYAVRSEPQIAADDSSPVDKRAAASRQEIERYLKSATVSKINKSDVSGRTAPWTVTLEEAGVSRRAIFKYIDHRRPDPLPDSYRYELAAYELARYLNLDLVPPVIERKIDDMEGSLQIFVENSISEWERKERNIQPADMKAFAQDMDDLMVLQNLVLDSCDGGQDTLLDRNTWKIYRVDFSESFAPKNSTVAECEISRCSRKLYQKLLAWNQERVRISLASYLNEEEIQALNARKDLIISIIKKLVATKGDGAVLY